MTLVVARVIAHLSGIARVGCGVPSAVIALFTIFFTVIVFHCPLLFVGLGATYFFINFLVAIQLYDLILFVGLFSARGGFPLVLLALHGARG